MGHRSEKGCWTCKARKIGCDKSLPACNNCKRTSRHCQDYGVKLKWANPDIIRPHSRSAQCVLGERTPCNLRRKHIFFLHTSTRDVKLSYSGILQRVNGSTQLLSPARPISSLRLHGPATDPLLFIYYEAVLSRMITTIDDRANGFRHILIPMTMSEANPTSATALSHTILALSAYHCSGPRRALEHKVKALNHLSRSWSEDSYAARLTQMAACMMLCVYEVFDASESKWYFHMNGAKSIASSFGVNQRGRMDNTAQSFLMSWLVYHDVLAGFSDPERALDGVESHVTASEQLYSDGTLIIGSLGCSLELMAIISRINDLARRRRLSDDTFLTRSEQEVGEIRQHLEDLRQTLRTAESGIIDESLVRQTAELYRIGAVIYLHLEAYRPSGYSEDLQRLVRHALKLLKDMSKCTSPWPIFVVALGCQDESQRTEILTVIQNMEQRRIDNIFYMHEIIEHYWKFKDLNSLKDDRHSIDWRVLVNNESFLPSFI